MLLAMGKSHSQIMRTRITESSWGHMAHDHHAPIHIQILIIEIEEYGDILVLMKF